MRTINNITANNEEYLRHGNGDRSKLKDYKNCEFKPFHLKLGTEDTPVILSFLHDPLHVIILGAPIDALDKLELFHPEEMNDFYKLLGLNKSGLSAGGKFNGPSVKKIMLEENLQILSQMLPEEKDPFM